MEISTCLAQIEDKLDELSELGNQGETFSEDQAREFQRICATLQSNAQDEWYGEAEDFSYLSQQLYQAVKQNRPEEAILIADSLRDAYVYLRSVI